MFFLLSIFAVLSQSEIQPNKLYQGNYDYLIEHCSIKFEKEDKFLTFDCARVGFTDSDIPHKNYGLIIRDNEKQTYKGVIFNPMFVFNHIDLLRLPIAQDIDTKGHSGTVDLIIHGFIRLDQVDINQKSFQKYLFQNYALFLSNNNIDLQKIQLKPFKND